MEYIKGMSEFKAEAVSSAAARLGRLADCFPEPEKNFFLELIERHDEELLGLLDRYDRKEISVEHLKHQVARKVVKTSVDYCYVIYNNLFENISTERAKQLVKGSTQASSAAEPAVALTYGEIDFHSFSCILEKLTIKKGDVFVDLGHGTGKALICASLLYGTLLSECIGIELIPELNDVSVGVTTAFRRMVNSDTKHFASSRMCDIRVMEGDILGSDFDWTVAGILPHLVLENYTILKN